ncbi:MAG: hypothetical protein ACPG9E_05130, partial [Poseidonia sp.]
MSPALPVPDLDKEVLLAQGKRVGMAPTLPAQETPPEANDDPEPATKPPATSTSESRRPTQDELMGYN